jgi:hypothetical protein
VWGWEGDKMPHIAQALEEAVIFLWSASEDQLVPRFRLSHRTVANEIFSGIEKAQSADNHLFHAEPHETILIVIEADFKNGLSNLFRTRVSRSNRVLKG